MKKKKKVIIATVGVVALAAAAFLFWGKAKNGEKDVLPKVKVTKNNIVDKALAVGTIEPEYEISVKSKVTGVVRKIFADVGVYVKVGDPLLEVKPDPTPLELAEAKRNVELAQVELDNVSKENIRQESLLKSALISTREYDDFQRKLQEAQLRVNIAKEKLALIQSERGCG